MYAADLPKPVLFHPLKHHLGYIRDYVSQNAMASTATIQADLRTLGSSQLDLYTGPLSPLQLAEEVVAQLQSRELLQPDPYRQFLAAAGADYRVLTLSDTTAWVLRWGVEEGRHVHLHPARYAANTLRVKANALKTAMAMVIAAAKFKVPTLDLQHLNQLRHDWLKLPPVRTLPTADDNGPAKLIQLLNQKQGT